MPIAKLGQQEFEYPETMGRLVLHAWHQNRIVGSYHVHGHVYPVTFDRNGRTTSWNRRYFPRIKPIHKGY